MIVRRRVPHLTHTVKYWGGLSLTRCPRCIIMNSSLRNSFQDTLPAVMLPVDLTHSQIQRVKDEDIGVCFL